MRWKPSAFEMLGVLDNSHKEYQFVKEGRKVSVHAIHAYWYTLSTRKKEKNEKASFKFKIKLKTLHLPFVDRPRIETDVFIYI